ncbi:Neurogenic locus notch-like protein [Melia azedarach]|uniref:Neurogenic locus notch-like protein n=1 Tax=Melia azedarach TaxID=155640 RepID=A0ACC1YFT0_MELAZ|nr:Neurogenic locus notch-like protein [Melia azedarach]
MASVNVVVFLAILLVLQPMTATSNFLSELSPLLPPALEDACEKVNCGRGKCKSSSNSSLLYHCECDPGWTQTTMDALNDTLKFLPCIVPNCTLNHACAQAPAPVQQKATKDNESIFDLCHWIDCGGGSCKKTSMFTYSCECAVDYFNLLNVSTFPCYKECAIGMDCKNLGLFMPMSPPPAPSLADNSENQAASNLLGNIHWLILLVMSLALVF